MRFHQIFRYKAQFVWRGEEKVDEGQDTDTEAEPVSNTWLAHENKKGEEEKQEEKVQGTWKAKQTLTL